jgi:hypothetical protein
MRVVCTRESMCCVQQSRRSALRICVHAWKDKVPYCTSTHAPKQTIQQLKSSLRHPHKQPRLDRSPARAGNCACRVTMKAASPPPPVCAARYTRATTPEANASVVRLRTGLPTERQMGEGGETGSSARRLTLVDTHESQASSIRSECHLNVIR